MARGLRASRLTVSVPRPASLRLLLVDDEAAIRFALQDYFARQGYVIDCASEPTEAWRLLRQGGPLLCILDLRLNGGERMDGLDLLAEIRRAELPVRVVVLTAGGSPEIEGRARQIGVDAFLHKPTPLPELKEVVDRLLTLSPPPPPSALPPGGHCARVPCV